MGVDVVFSFETFGVSSITSSLKIKGSFFVFFSIFSSKIFGSFLGVTVQMLFSLGAVFNYYSVFDTVLDTDTVGAISGSFTNTIFFLYGMYVYLLVRTDKRRDNLLSNRTQTVGTIFAAIIIPVQALTLFGLVPDFVFGPLFILGGVILYPLFIIGVGDAIGNHEV